MPHAGWRHIRAATSLTLGGHKLNHIALGFGDKQLLMGSVLMILLLPDACLRSRVEPRLGWGNRRP